MARSRVLTLGTLSSNVTPQLIHTVGAGGEAIDLAQFTNTSTQTVTITLAVKKQGVAGLKTVVKNYPITVSDASIKPFAGRLYFAAGDEIYGRASAADVVDYVINGIGGFLE